MFPVDQFRSRDSPVLSLKNSVGAYGGTSALFVLLSASGQFNFIPAHRALWLRKSSFRTLPTPPGPAGTLFPP